MKKIKEFVFSCCIFGWGTITLAQNGIVATGGNAAGGGGNVSYSIGQIDYITATGSGGNINQGIQQPYEIFTSINDESEISKSISVFPNPATNLITFNSNLTHFENLSLKLFDIEGREIKSIVIDKSIIDIPMLDHSNGIYFLNVYDNSKQVGQFKIVKNK